jgi:hypothetical protein
MKGTTTINQMPATRSGETNYKVGPEHQGQYARVSGAFASGNHKKGKTVELRATHLQTAHNEQRQKRIRLSEPSPPTPTKKQLIKLPRATRHSKPCCLHYRIDRAARKIIFPHHFFCGHCKDYIEAMIHSSRKLLVKKDSCVKLTISVIFFPNNKEIQPNASYASSGG